MFFLLRRGLTSGYRSLSSPALGGDAAFKAQRSQQLAELEEFSRAPYPHASASHSLAEVRAVAGELAAGERGALGEGGRGYSVTGRVHHKRSLGHKLCFYELRDGMGGALQVMATAEGWDASAAGPFKATHEALRKGDVVQATGRPAKSQHGEPSLVPSRMRLLAPCLHDVPQRIDDAQAKLDQQYLLMRTSPEGGAEQIALRSLRLRARVYRALRAFLDGRGFTEVETPVLSPVAGGAAAHPFVTQAREAFGKALPLYLRIAPELYLKQLLVAGLDRVYELGKQFRNEGIDARHNPEFTTLEFYQAYASAADLMAMTEQLLARVVSAALELPDHEPHPWSAAPFARVSAMEALEGQFGARCSRAVLGGDRAFLLELALDIGALTHQEAASLRPSLPKVIDRIIGHSVEPLCVGPTFLVDLPLCLSPLARESAKLPGTADRFEMFSRGVELINSYSELNDPSEQRRRFLQQQQYQAEGDAETHPPDEHFCMALEYAMPPAAGWGLGVDRLLMQILDTEHIRDVIVTPRPHDRV